MKKAGILGVLVIGVFAIGPLIGRAETTTPHHVEAELISEVLSVKPGESFWTALRLRMEPGWHTYWQNPGDAGLPTTIEWELPAGFSAGPLLWSFPEKIQ